MSEKYAKLERKNRQLRMPLERKLINLCCLGLLTFLVTVLAASALAPVQTSVAMGEVLSAIQATGGAISLSTSASTINLSLATGADGAVRTAMDTVRMTSDLNGYQLYLSTVGTNNALVRDGTDGDATTDKVPATSYTDIAAPAALPSDTWGFATLAQGSGTGAEDVVENGFDGEYGTGDASKPTNKFIAVPGKGEDVLIARRAGAANGVTTNVYYGIHATSAKPSGTYKNTVMYTAIGDGNVANLSSVSPSRTKVVQGGEILTIATNNTLDLTSISSVEVTVGGVACTNATPVKNGALTNATCTSPALSTGWHEVVVNIHTVNDTVETYVVNPGIEYYLEAGETELATYMQDFTMAECAMMAYNTSTTLQDKRDNNVYTVSKLADGNCWMAQNLRLGTSSTGGVVQGVRLGSGDSDVSSDFMINVENIITENGEDWSADADVVHVYSFAGTEYEKLYGNLYNFYTATAGTGTSGLIEADASGSICPKGWKLPASDNVIGSFPMLFRTIAAHGGLGFTVNYGDASSANVAATEPIAEAPYNYVFSGNYEINQINNQGSASLNWSRKASDEGNGYDFRFYTNGAYNFQYGTAPRSIGRAVRCVFIGVTMQTFTSTVCNNLAMAATVTLRDERDNNRYTAAKLADGNCWMTQNMRLGVNPRNLSAAQAFTLTSADSNVVSNFSSNSADMILPSGTTASTSSKAQIYLTGDRNYGNLYNWLAATAGTGTTSITTGDAKASICPKGWYLPPSEGEGSYYNLLVKGGVTSAITGSSATFLRTVLSAPYSFVLAGAYGSTHVGANGYGDYMSRTSATSNSYYISAINSNNSYNLRFTVDKDGGRAVRCYFAP